MIICEPHFQFFLHMVDIFVEHEVPINKKRLLLVILKVTLYSTQCSFP